MSKIAVSGNASGTGVFTIASPNSNTDRTLTLPDATGTVQVSGNPISGTTGTFSGAVSGTTGTFTSGVSVGPSVTFGDATVQTTAAGAPTTAQVLTATAGASAGAVGTYCFAQGSGYLVFGSTKAGSSLRAAGAAFTVFQDAGIGSMSFDGSSGIGFNSSTLSGTWRCLGMGANLSGWNTAALYLRIS
jgi:hypothetical protein